MKTYIIYDSKLKDGLRKKINDESITIEGDWSKEGINAAKRMGLTFTLTGRYENGFPVAKISGDKQKLIKYFKKWYDQDFFEDGYDVFDSKVVDSKLKDVRLEKGDWFVNRNDTTHTNSLKLSKVIDDRNLSTNGFAKAMICEKYVVRRNDDTYKFTIRKEGRETIHYDAYLKQNAVRFNSAEEALNWLRRRVKIGNTNKTCKW